ncbi:hypothetical protein PALB_8910 [Pseudoalteromonas luteoviolacea B = ATCC 29581]|nr:hypothetical protein PALB_8910 [Pseudoalteromonas luteoviolacea B = ATCC 29581]
MKIVLTIFLIIVLTGCGGGSSPDETNVVTTPETQTPVVITTPTPIPTETAINKTSDLVIEPQFDLSTTITLNISIDLKLTDRAFVNLCEANSDGSANLNACIWKAPLGQSLIERKLTLARLPNMLVAEVWYYTPNTTPSRFTWQFEPDATVQQFIIQ